MVKFFKQTLMASLSFIRSLTSPVNVPDRRKCMSLNHKPCIDRPAFIGLRKTFTLSTHGYFREM